MTPKTVLSLEQMCRGPEPFPGAATSDFDWIDYSSLPIAKDGSGSDSPDNLAYAVRQRFEKLDPNKDGLLFLEESPSSPNFDWGLELGFLTGVHPAQKKFNRLWWASSAFIEQYNFCKCVADGPRKPTPLLPQNGKPMFCEESGRKRLEDLKKGLEFTFSWLR